MNTADFKDVEGEDSIKRTKLNSMDIVNSFGHHTRVVFHANNSTKEWSLTKLTILEEEMLESDCGPHMPKATVDIAMKEDGLDDTTKKEAFLLLSSILIFEAIPKSWDPNPDVIKNGGDITCIRNNPYDLMEPTI
jgi:hypothetical protein